MIAHYEEVTEAAVAADGLDDRSTHHDHWHWPLEAEEHRGAREYLACDLARHDHIQSEEVVGVIARDDGVVEYETWSR